MSRVTKFAIVGESFYQSALRLALDRDGSDTQVRLECEPTNKYDPNAVRVCDGVTGETLGYLDRRAAGEYCEHIDHEQSFDAELHGGTPEKPSIGLVLEARPLIKAKRRETDDDDDDDGLDDDDLDDLLK